MINDPYIEIINKTKSLNLDEAVIVQSIDKYLKGGADKTLAFLIHDKKTAESEAWKLVEEIKKEFKSSYFAGALYAGVFLVLFLGFLSVMLYFGFWNLWLLFCALIVLFCAWRTIKSLVMAFSIT